MLEFLLANQPHFGCEDHEGVMAATIIDTFLDFALQAAVIKDQVLTIGPSAEQSLKDQLQLIKDYLAGLSYVLMMHMGNDVLYFKKEHQLAIYTVLRDHLVSRLRQSQGVKLTAYARLLIEPMFAYNHFEDAGEEYDIDEVDDFDGGTESSDEGEAVAKDGKFKMQVHIEQTGVDGLPMEDKKIVIKHKPKKTGKKAEPVSSSSSDESEGGEPEFLEQMKAFLGETPEDQYAYLKAALLTGTEDVLSITDPVKQVDMLLAVILLSESMVNKSDEDEPSFKFFVKHFADIRNLMRRLLLALRKVHLSGAG
jgi:hypothetical protein